MKNIFTVVIAISLIFFSCKEDQSTKFPTLDLIENGLPITIHAPADAVVKMTDLGVMKDVTVKSGDNYYLQIFSAEATVLDPIKLAAKVKNEVKMEDQFFSKFVLEEDHGFIYEKQIGDRINYDFRYIKVQGDSEYIFQTGLVGTYTEEQVREIYDSVK